MLFTSKSNTNATTNTTATETTETTNTNGGLIKGIAIGVGTLAGIGAAYFGHKVYKSHHVVADENNLEDANVDDEEGSKNVTENNETVESFNEVDTEETNESAPVEAEEAKTEETNESAPVEAEEAKTEETKNEAPVEDEKPSATSLVDQLEKEASVFEKEMVLPFEVKTAIEQMDYLMGRIAQCHRTIGDNARIDVALRKMQNGVKDFWLGINTKLAMQTSELESLDVIEDLFGADMDMVDRAYFDMQYINKSTLVLGTKDATVQFFNRLVRVADKMSKKSSTKSTGETQTVENAFDVFKDGHKESNKVDGETKTSTKPSVGENQTTENCFDAFKEGHKETNKVEKSSTKKVTGETKTVTKASGKKQTKAKASKTGDALAAINQFAETSCEEMVKSSLKSLASLDYVLDVKDQKPCEWLHEVAKHVDSNIDGLLKTNHTAEAFKLIKVAKRDIEYAVSEVVEYMIIAISNAATVEDLDNIKASVAALSDSIKLNHVKVYQATINRINDVKTSLNNMYTQIKTAGETKTAEPVVDETQTTTKESPSETQIGNSTVISDDGETVTLTAEVSQESIDSVNDVINIVSVIPDRDHPETNDMPYFIRVIGGRIRGIKEPEATFLAYDDTSKSNKFIDACVDVCDMTGKAICNLANSDNDPVSSMAWINRCTDELVASSIIDNTYDPRKYKAAILKARNSAIRVLSKRITPEIAKEHGLSVNEKSSNETQADDKSSGETQTEETLTYTMSEKIQEAVQQSDETAATAAPEPDSQAPMSPEASSLASKLQEVGALMRAEKWSDAAEFYKTQLTPYLADDGLSKELRDEIMGIKTKATNMLMSQKQLEAKQKAASAKASKRKSSKRRRH